VTSVERNRSYWEVKILGKDGVEREVHVNPVTGKATLDRDHNGGRDDDRPAVATATAGPRIDDNHRDRGGDDDGPNHDLGDDHGGRHGGDDHGGDDHGGGRHGGDDG